MSKSSLSSVVSNLVRASMGASVSSTVADEDLDRHVAELILKEAKQKAEKYAKEGIRAYIPQPDSNAPKTNKRFLSSIIRSTDDHNKTILRSQALAAQEVRMERLEQEKKDRRARAEEAVEAERLRRLMGGSGRPSRRDGGERREGKRRERSWERRSDEEEDDWGKKRSKERKDRDRNDYRRRRRHHSRSRSPRRDGESSRRRGRHGEDYHRRRYRSRSRSTDDSMDNYRQSKRRERDVRRAKSRDRSMTIDDEGDDYHYDRKRKKRSRTRSVDISEEDEGYHGRGRSHRSSERKRRRTPSPIPSEASLATSGSSTQQKRDDARKNDTPNTLDDGLLHSQRASPTRENEESSGSRSAILLDNGVRLDRPKAPSRSSSRLSPDSNDRSRSHEQPEAGPSTLPPPPSRDPSLSPGPPPPPRLDTPPPPPPPPPVTKVKPKSLHRSSRHHSRKSKPAPPPPADAPPPLPSHLPSKMDKYFEESYDPRLDVAPLSAPTIPATGLINDAEFAGWDAMLELIRQRREDKEEKKRLERWGIGKDKGKEVKSKSAAAASDTVDIMSIEYKKRGAVREWDLGKEGF